ncbi:MAG: homocysteine S-methyltransferase family protein, partial [Oscillospiraceae bacterium]
KLSAFGLEDKVTKINEELVHLSKSVSKNCYVAGDISSTGLIAEPFGETTFAQIISIYNEQAAALDKAGADLFVIEKCSSLSEMRAAVIACKKFKKPIFVTIAITDKGKTLSGSTPLSCLIVLQAMGIDAFGINCATSQDALVEALKEIAPFAKIPLIAKPNAGSTNTSSDILSPEEMAELLKPLLSIGVSIIGGCCQTTAEHIKKMRELIDTNRMIKTEYDYTNDIYLANETEFFALDNDRIEFSPLIKCTHDMADDFIDAETDSYDVLWISVNSADEAKQFALNSHLSKLPICFKSDDEVTLKAALLLYNGRCLIDSQTAIDETELKKIASKYGAIIY